MKPRFHKLEPIYIEWFILLHFSHFHSHYSLTMAHFGRKSTFPPSWSLSSANKSNRRFIPYRKTPFGQTRSAAVNTAAPTTRMGLNGGNSVQSKPQGVTIPPEFRHQLFYPNGGKPTANVQQVNDNQKASDEMIKLSTSSETQQLEHNGQALLKECQQPANNGTLDGSGGAKFVSHEPKVPSVTLPPKPSIGQPLSSPHNTSNISQLLSQMQLFTRIIQTLNSVLLSMHKQHLSQTESVKLQTECELLKRLLYSELLNVSQLMERAIKSASVK